MAVLDLKAPPRAPHWLVRAGVATIKPFATNEEWMARRSWEMIRTAMQARLADLS